MSRIGKKAILVPSGVTVELEDGLVLVSGKRGRLEERIPNGINVAKKDDQILVTPVKLNKKIKAAWGLMRAQIANMVTGVSVGFKKELSIIGVGYKASVAGKKLKLSLGFSHDINFPIPDDIRISVEKNTLISVEGNDPQLVGQVCADIRQFRTPEPYKGKGVRYTTEQVLIKEGKKK